MKRSGNASPDTRRGSTLVELAVVIGLTSFVLGTVAIALHAMYQADHQLRDELLFSSALSRLAAQLRTDAHECDMAQIDAGDATKGSRLLLQMSAQQTIEYLARQGQVDRLVRQADQVVHRESYRLLEGADLSWMITQEHQLPIVTLRIAFSVQNIPQPSSPQRVIQIQAATGLDRQLD